jgi:hypothetical protein
VAKILWAAIRVRPDLITGLLYFTCQIKSPGQDDMKKTGSITQLYAGNNKPPSCNWNEHGGLMRHLGQDQECAVKPKPQFLWVWDQCVVYLGIKN